MIYYFGVLKSLHSICGVIVLFWQEYFAYLLAIDIFDVVEFILVFHWFSPFPNGFNLLNKFE